MYNCPRAATITAKGSCKLWALNRLDFKHFMITNQKSQQSQAQIVFKKVPMLKKLPAATLDAVMQALTRKRYADGTEIIRQGDDGDTFYIVEEGKVDVIVDGQTKSELSQGDFFGERALQENDKRNATIKAKGDCLMLELGRNDFEELFGPIMAQVNQASADREAKSGVRRQLINCDLQKLRVIAVLGKGAFGVVQLVEKLDSPKEADGKPPVYALKMLQKKQLVATKQTQNIKREKCLMHEMDHPFILKLVSTVMDSNCLYLLLEFLQGGDLFSKLCEYDGYFDVPIGVYYIATVCSGLGYMHSLGIVYRDLKPENLVLGGDGTCKIVDFGMAKKVEQRTFTVCGTPEYMAPEIINSQGHNKGADYWAMGILAYEISYGTSPFADPAQNHMRIYKAINKCKLTFPMVNKQKKHAALQDFCKCLLKRRPMKRYGMRISGVQEIKDHKYFSEAKIDWAKADQGDLKPSLPGPKNSSKHDVTAFGEWGGIDPPMQYTSTGADFEAMWEKEFPKDGIQKE
jgi:cGMP-dependent protein kinase